LAAGLARGHKGLGWLMKHGLAKSRACRSRSGMQS